MTRAGVSLGGREELHTMPLALVLAASLAAAAGAAPRVEYACSFSRHVVAEWRGDRWAEWKAGNQDEPILLLLSTDGFVTGSDNVRAAATVTRGQSSVTFAETTLAGNVMTTTVSLYARTFDGKFAAIHSRHFTDGAGAMPSLFLGSCIAR